jgi:hypothetical protein
MERSASYDGGRRPGLAASLRPRKCATHRRFDKRALHMTKTALLAAAMILAASSAPAPTKTLNTYAFGNWRGSIIADDDEPSRMYCRAVAPETYARQGERLVAIAGNDGSVALGFKWSGTETAQGVQVPIDIWFINRKNDITRFHVDADGRDGAWYFYFDLDAPSDFVQDLRKSDTISVGRMYPVSQFLSSLSDPISLRDVSTWSQILQSDSETYRVLRDLKRCAEGLR